MPLCFQYSPHALQSSSFFGPRLQSGELDVAQWLHRQIPSGLGIIISEERAEVGD